MSITIDLNDVGYELTYWLKNKDLLVKTNQANAILVCAHAARWIVLCSGWEIGTCPDSDSVNGIVLAQILKISNDDMILVLKTSIITDVLNLIDDESDDEDDNESDDEDAENANAENAEVSDDPC